MTSLLFAFVFSFLALGSPLFSTTEPPKTVLLVGGAGFIGSHVNEMLNREGYRTVVFDNLSRGSREAVIRGTFFKGDLLDPKSLDLLFQEYPIDAVMHFAASTEVGESVENPLKYYQNNVTGTLNLLQAMQNHGVSLFIFSSTAAVFGNPLQSVIGEDHPQHPINPYGQSKLMVETLLPDLAKAYGLRFCCLRYFNAAGGDPQGVIKNYRKEEPNLIPIILKKLLTESEPCIIINGTDYPTFDGTCIRDFIHVDDIGQAHILAMHKLFEGTASPFYNLGNGHGFSVKEVIAAVRRTVNIPFSTLDGQRRAGDPPILIASSVKAMNELGWRPKYPSLDQMIEHTWNAMKDSQRVIPLPFTKTSRDDDYLETGNPKHVMLDAYCSRK